MCMDDISWIREDHDVPSALYHASLGRTVLDYIKREDGQVIRQAMECRAAGVVEQIFRILEDEELEDPDCLLKIDAIIRLYFNELELRCDRHIEME